MSKILAVEDDETQRYVLNIVLENFGMDFEMASSAEEAMDVLFLRAGGKFTVVLMDIKLPGMSGLECTREIRKLEKELGIRRHSIIAVTAYAAQEDRRLCFAAGMDDYISKPYSLDVFKALIEKYLTPVPNEPSELSTEGLTSN